MTVYDLLFDAAVAIALAALVCALLSLLAWLAWLLGRVARGVGWRKAGGRDIDNYVAMIEAELTND